MPPPCISRAPIVPDRIRRIDCQSFAFLPHRFLREGFLSALSPTELRLYVFLVLAADRNGPSFYGFERICGALEIDLDDLLDARNGLIDKDLIAFDGTRFQVLSLPSRRNSRKQLEASPVCFDDGGGSISRRRLGHDAARATAWVAPSKLRRSTWWSPPGETSVRPGSGQLEHGREGARSRRDHGAGGDVWSRFGRGIGRVRDGFGRRVAVPRVGRATGSRRLRP